jgi:uncharacterized protein YgiM (DUF1202 family)
LAKSKQTFRAKNEGKFPKEWNKNVQKISDLLTECRSASVTENQLGNWTEFHGYKPDVPCEHKNNCPECETAKIKFEYAQSIMIIAHNNWMSMGNEKYSLQESQKIGTFEPKNIAKF